MVENTAFVFVDEEPEEKNRKTGYIRKKSRNGKLNVLLSVENAEKVRRYCEIHNTNCSEFVNGFIAERIDEVMRSKYDNLTREELLDLVKKMEAEHAGH